MKPIKIAAISFIILGLSTLALIFLDRDFFDLIFSLDARQTFVPWAGPRWLAVFAVPLLLTIGGWQLYTGRDADNCLGAYSAFVLFFY